MRKIHTNRALALLCVVALLLACVGCGVPAKGQVTPVTYEDNSVAKILERDGYLDGIWYPWLTHDNLGHGLTANETMVRYVGNRWSTVGIDQYSDKHLLSEIYNLKALGYNVMGYEGSIYAEGVIFDENGDVLGVKEDYLSNIRRLLNICRQAEMPVLWTVCCHSTSMVDYYNMEAWFRVSQMYAVREVADHYVERFVKPVCQVLAEYPDVVVLVASTSEVENEMNDPDMGNFTEHRETYGVTKESMLYFVDAVTDMVAEVLPDVDRTLCGSTDNMSMYSEMNFTYIGHQEYNSDARADDISQFRSPLPMLATEYGLGDGISPTEDEQIQKQKRFRDNFISKGWSGWLFWCWTPTSSGSSYDLLEKNATGRTQFRPWVYEIKDYIEAYRARYRGDALTLSEPTMLFNNGDGTVEWIKPSQSHTYQLQRSINGGAWVTLDTSGATLDSTGRKYTYKDGSLPASGTVQYRVVATSGSVTKTANSNTVDIMPPPTNLAVNGGFENGLDSWSIFGNNGTYRALTGTSYEGSACLELDYASVEWQGVNQSGITVKPYTNYVLTYYYKYAVDATANNAYCFVRSKLGDGSGNGLGNIDDAVLGQAYMNKGSMYQWRMEQIVFRTNDTTKLGIDFRVVTGTHVYIDSVTLYEVQ